MLGGLGAQEMLIIVGVLLLLFGAKRIPEIAKGLGRGITDFKKALNASEDEETQERTLEEKKEEETPTK